MAKKKGDKLPRSVKALVMTRKEWAKKNGLDYKSDKERVKEEYAEVFLEGLDRGMEIIMESPNSELAEKATKNIEFAICRPKRMGEAADLYPENRKRYTHIVFLPNIIMDTIEHLHKDSDKLTEEELLMRAKIDEDELIRFCRKIVKKQIKHYEACGLSPIAAFQLASLTPSAKILGKSYWHKALIMRLYQIAETEKISDMKTVFEAISKVDKEREITKRDLKRKFWLEFILMKKSIRFKNLNDSQKDLHEMLQREALEYLNDLSESEIESMLMKYIDRRKKSESNGADGNRIFRFVDHANSNSPYTKIKKAVEKIIKNNPDNEVYLK